MPQTAQNPWTGDAGELILASASPRRKELLGWITPDFRVCPSTGEELVPAGTPAAQTAELLARTKAISVAKAYPAAVVIGCDTVVTLGEQVLGKPRTAEHCREMLTLLSGKTHVVYTGVCLCQGQHITSFTAAAAVTFYPLTDREIADYIATGEPFDKAGGYGIQGRGGLLAERISGDYYAIVGLPVARLKRELEQFCAGH